MKAKILEWLARYLPLEMAATAFALAGGIAADALNFNPAVVAFAAAWAENAGFYGYALVREVRRLLGHQPLSFASVRLVLLPSARTLLYEFGPAEALDSLFLRPACMYLAPQLTGALATGLLLGKVVADVAFFAIAIVAYEWRKSRG